MNLRELWRKKRKGKKAKKSKAKTCITSLHIYSCVYSAPKRVVQLFGSAGKTGTGEREGERLGLINVNQYLIRCTNVNNNIRKTQCFALFVSFFPLEK